MKASQAASGISAYEAAWTAAEAIAFDRFLQEELGLPAALLMENAGAALAKACLEALAETRNDRIVLICGPGNNGGDGLVAARHLAGRGPRVEVWCPLGGARERLDPLRGLLPLASGLLLHPQDAPFPGGPALRVDALFGLGLSRPLYGNAREIVEAMHHAGAPILAADLPSGLDADRGEILGAAVRADCTLSFVAPKRGLLTGAGPSHSGKLRTAGIGVADAVAAAWRARRRAAPKG